MDESVHPDRLIRETEARLKELQRRSLFTLDDSEKVPWGEKSKVYRRDSFTRESDWEASRESQCAWKLPERSTPAPSV